MAVLVHRLHTASPADFDLFEDFRTAFDNFFSSQRPLFSLSERLWNPPTDVYETAEAVFIKMEIAGLRDDDIDITVEDNLLRIRGCRREETPAQVDAGPGASERANYHLMEIRYGGFERTFGLPSKLDVDAISASYHDGFLEIKVPKRRSSPREITIEVK